jgi:dCMP deaminase
MTNLHPLEKQKQSQKDKDGYFLQIANTVATRATCPRRKVGCVLVDSKQHIVATGYNGVPSGFTHCTDIPCEGAECPSGTGLDLCEAIHAEVNAFLQLRSDDELTAYVTIMPCFPCAKMMANSNIKRLVAAEEYVHNQSIEMLQKADISINIVK